jgi:hypothetical protein
VSVRLRETRHAIHPLGPVAQLVEHVTFNHRVAGSSPARLTIVNYFKTNILTTTARLAVTL